MLGRRLAALSAYSLYATGLTLRLFPLLFLLAPLLPPTPPFDLCLTPPPSSARRSSADNTGGGSGGPGLPGNFFLTNRIAALTCCISSSRSACSSLCVHCGETVWLLDDEVRMCTAQMSANRGRSCVLVGWVLLMSVCMSASLGA